MMSGNRPRTTLARVRRASYGWIFGCYPGSGSKARYLRDLVFPPAEFMRSKFAGERGQWLPWLYARRSRSAGAWRRLRGRVI